jgi:Na+/phosphate symporter
MKKLENHKKQLGRIVLGVIIILFAWTLIATVIKELGVKPNYVLLDVFQG